MNSKSIRNLLKNVSSFDWDKGNIDKNLKKHGVTKEECQEVFFNKPKVIRIDKKHSINERRFFIYGLTDWKRKLVVVFTFREHKLRVISARDMKKGKERDEFNKLLT